MSDTEIVQGKEFEFKTLDEMSPGESSTILYYGGSKTGKTWFCGTAGDRTLFLNIGLGIDTLLSPGFRAQNGTIKPIVVTIVERLGDNGIFSEADMFNKCGDAIEHALQHFPDRFDTVVLDDATALRRGAMNKALEIAQVLRKSKVLGTSKQWGAILPEVGEYGIEMNLVEQFVAFYIDKLKSVEKHFIMTAHERILHTKPDKIGGEPVFKRVQPNFTGKDQPDIIPQYFDNVWHAEAVGGGSNIVYRCRTAGSESEIAGSRDAGVFETVEINPNFLKMQARIRESKAATRKTLGRK